jgi:hypothetical protein
MTISDHMTLDHLSKVKVRLSNYLSHIGLGISKEAIQLAIQSFIDSVNHCGSFEEVDKGLSQIFCQCGNRKEKDDVACEGCMKEAIEDCKNLNKKRLQNDTYKYPSEILGL